MDWWAIIRRPSGAVHLYQLGPEPYANALAAAVTEQAVPAQPGPGWDISVTLGEPHPELIWSGAQLKAARDQIEARDGLPQRRAAVQAIRDALEATAANLPPEAVAKIREDFKNLDSGVRQVLIGEIREALASVSPSRATIHRLP